MSVLAAAVLMAPSSFAAGFSAPVLLNAGGLTSASRIAVNDRGEAVAVSVSGGRTYCTGEQRPEAGQLVLQQIGSLGAVGPSQTLTMPGFFNVSASQEPSVTLGDRGQVAVGLVYQDGTSPSSCEPHNAECCARDAIATWQLGGGSPVLQVLAPPEGKREVQQADGPPMIALSRSMITAVWAWNREPYPEPERVSLLQQAYGRFGAPLQTAPLATRPVRISAFNPPFHGGPSAAWLGWPGEHGREAGVLYRAIASPSGSLTPAAHGQRLLRPDSEAIGFANDDDGDTAFAYEPALDSEGINAIALAFSVKGRPFSRARVVGYVHGLAQPQLAAGGHRSLLITWTDESNRIYAQRGSVLGPFDKPVFIAKEEGSYDAFLDAHGRAVIVYDRRVAHRHGLWEEVAVIASPSGRFGHPRRIAPPKPAGALGLGQALAAVSPNGHAIMLVGSESGREFMVRYTP